MLKKLIFTLLMLAPSICHAQLDNMSRLLLRRQPLPQSRSEAEEPPYYSLIVQIADDEAVGELGQLGVIIHHRRGDLLLTAIPRDNLDRALAVEGVVNAQAAGLINGVLDRARPVGKVDLAQSGEGLLRGYDGSGVIVGLSDTGFDPHHVAFDGRVKAVYDFDIERNIISKAETPRELAAWVMPMGDADTGDATAHATHVANIIAGGFRGNEYYGAAPGAEIVAATSRLTDVGILCGVEAVIAHAKAEGKPAVVNLSLSNHLGPHDGTSLCSRYLADCAREAVICLSAGNAGRADVSAWATLTPAGPVARVDVNSFITWNGFDVGGYTDIWCLDDSKVKFRFEVFDFDTRAIVYASDWVVAEGDDSVSLRIDYDEDPAISPYLTGILAAEAGLSPLNGRYNIAVAYDTDTRDFADGHPWARYYVTMAVALADGCDEASVAFFSDANMSYLGYAGEATANFGNRASINDMATADGVLAVGACSTRNTAPLLSGAESSWSFNVGEVARFTSYSNLPGLGRYPHFCAPGNYVVSAVSDHFATSEGRDIMAAEAVVDEREYYWSAMCGTSMSAPYAAGVAALWLQADPTLTSREIRDIAIETASSDFADSADPRWGAGCIDAMAGLVRILTTEASVGEVLGGGEPLVEIAGRCVKVTMPSGSRATPRLHTVAGAPAQLGVPLPSGLYILTIPGYPAQKLRL